MKTDAPLIFLIAGEASGDALGAKLMQGLKQLTEGRIRFVGIGGHQMQAEGLESLFPMEDLALFGLAEILPKIPKILRRMKQTIQAVADFQPDCVVSIDAPDFSFRVQKKLRRLRKAGKIHAKQVHYVAPTVWAWRPGRAKKIAQFLDHLMVLLPFEPPYFTRHGLSCDFVGHSVVESGADKGQAERFRAACGLEGGTPLLCLLPGSRQSEIDRLLPDFSATLGLLREKLRDWQIVLPTLPHLREQIAAAVADWPVKAHIIDGRDQQLKYDAYAASSLALAASGTVSLELALARLPTIIAYRVNYATIILAAPLIHIDYISLVNLIENRMIMPEYVQLDCRPRKLAAALSAYMNDTSLRAEQVRAAHQVALKLGLGDEPPGLRAAHSVLRVLGR